MPNPSLQHSVSDDTYKAILRALIKIPQSGAEFYTIAGEANTLAKVLLAPGGGLSRYHRRLAEAHPVVVCSVRGDSETWRPTPSPKDFHQVTLRWLIDSATDIGIWSAPFPQFSDDVSRWWEKAARFRLTIETTADKAAEWADLVRRWKRRAASLRFFGPESAEAVR